MNQPNPTRYLANGAAAAMLLQRFARRGCEQGASYATVRDYCQSADFLPEITGRDGDLKNVQRPWAVKAVLGCLAPPARLLEIGGGEPVVSGFLAELGYDVTLIDPYDGFGNGPTEFEQYVRRFPHVRLVRDYLRAGMRDFERESFDIIFSVSVLEHIPPDPLASCFAAIGEFLRPNGISLHCFDFVLQGLGAEYAEQNARQILALQQTIAGVPAGPDAQFDNLLPRLVGDLETFYLSPQGHHSWRGGQPYDAFPFRKVASVQTIARRTARASVTSGSITGIRV